MSFTLNRVVSKQSLNEFERKSWFNMTNLRFLALNSYEFGLNSYDFQPKSLYIMTKLKFLALNLYNLELKKARRLPQSFLNIAARCPCISPMSNARRP